MTPINVALIILVDLALITLVNLITMEVPIIMVVQIIMEVLTIQEEHHQDNIILKLVEKMENWTMIVALSKVQLLVLMD